MSTNGAVKVITCLFFAISCGLLLWKKTPTASSVGTESKTPTGHGLRKGDNINFAVILSNDPGCSSSTAIEEISNWTKSYMVEDFRSNDYQLFGKSNDNLDGRQSNRQLAAVSCADLPLCSSPYNSICIHLCPHNFCDVFCSSDPFSEDCTQYCPEYFCDDFCDPGDPEQPYTKDCTRLCPNYNDWICERKCEQPHGTNKDFWCNTFCANCFSFDCWWMNINTCKNYQGDDALLNAQCTECFSSDCGNRRLSERSPLDPAMFEGKSVEEVAAMAPLVVNVGHGYNNDETGIKFPHFESSDPMCDATTLQLMVF